MFRMKLGLTKTSIFIRVYFYKNAIRKGTPA